MSRSRSKNPWGNGRKHSASNRRSRRPHRSCVTCNFEKIYGKPLARDQRRCSDDIEHEIAEYDEARTGGQSARG